MSNKFERIYEKLEALGVLAVIKNGGNYVKSSSGGYMDLHLDVLTKDEHCVIISLAHNFVQNGDVCADPDMQIRVISDAKEAEAMTFQQSIPPAFQEVYPEKNKVNVMLKHQLNAFLDQWLFNAIDQGHCFKKVKVA